MDVRVGIEQVYVTALVRAELRRENIGSMYISLYAGSVGVNYVLSMGVRSCMSDCIGGVRRAKNQARNGEIIAVGTREPPLRTQTATEQFARITR